MDRVDARRIAGESLRDVGILIFVFGPLDAIYQEGSAALGLTLAGLGLCFMWLGMILEVKRMIPER